MKHLQYGYNQDYSDPGSLYPTYDWDAASVRYCFFRIVTIRYTADVISWNVMVR